MPFSLLGSFDRFIHKSSLLSARHRRWSRDRSDRVKCLVAQNAIASAKPWNMDTWELDSNAILNVAVQRTCYVVLDRSPILVAGLEYHIHPSFLDSSR
jgi:hypothetical protein